MSFLLYGALICLNLFCLSFQEILRAKLATLDEIAGSAGRSFWEYHVFIEEIPCLLLAQAVYYCKAFSDSKGNYYLVSSAIYRPKQIDQNVSVVIGYLYEKEEMWPYAAEHHAQKNAQQA